MAAKRTTKKSTAAKKSNVSKDELLKFYNDMLLIRRFEEKAGQLYGMGLIGGFCHLYIGQEAVVVGLEAAAKENAFFAEVWQSQKDFADTVVPFWAGAQTSNAGLGRAHAETLKK